MVEANVSENYNRSVGRDAQRSNILAAKVVADMIKTTLGPKGMDKMLVGSDGEIIVTNDGVTILREIDIEHPAARMIVKIAETQEREVGDGTTTAALLAGKLLERAETLLDRKIHPTVIAEGYRKAAERAVSFLDSYSSDLKDKDVLLQIAMTAMTGKGAEGQREKLGRIVVEAVEKIAEGKKVEVENIKLEKIVGGSVRDSELVEGIVLGKERANKTMPERVDAAKILLVDFPLEVRNPEIDAKVSVSTPEQLESFVRSEENFIRELTRRIIDSGANVVFCQRGIDDLAQYYLAKAGIFALRRVTKSDMEKIARATSGKIVSDAESASNENFGLAESVEEIRKDDEGIVYIRGCKNPAAVTIVIYGGTEHVVDETERAVVDAIGDVSSAVKSGKVVAGGGASEVETARQLRNFARSFSGREQLAVEEFANALETIPETLAENAGLDPINILTELKKRHEAGAARDGINLLNGRVEDCFEAGVVEPLKVKTQAISSASEVATMILRVDDVLIRKNKKQEKTEEVID